MKRTEISFVRYVEPYRFATFVIIWTKEEKWYELQAEPDSECSMYLTKDNGNTRMHVVDFTPYSDDINDILEMAGKYATRFLEKQIEK